jgi:23S rRNA pseudouridine2605 synthase
MADGIRLQRFLAQAGVASRRKSEELIQAGRVAVNGKVVKELGTRVDPRQDRVTFDGRRVTPERHVWLLLNKPDACVSTADDPEGRQTVLDVLGPQEARVYPVGRLDYHTQGVLLLTNDGALAEALTHPRNQLLRAYHVKVKGVFDPGRLEPLRSGVTLDSGETVSAKVALMGATGKHTWIEMVLTQGLNRQVHRMLEAVGLEVLKLVRVAFGPLTAEDLPPGRYRELTQREVTRLREAVRLPAESKARPRGGGRRQGRARKKAPARKGGPPSKAGPPKKGGPPGGGRRPRR